MGMQQTSLQLADLTTEVHTQDVVSEPIQVLTLSEKVALAIKAIKAQVLAGRHLSCAFSGGKDSSVTLAINQISEAHASAVGSGALAGDFFHVHYRW